MDHAKRGAALLQANNALEAAAAYTKALIEHPTSPDYYIQRSTAFTRLSPPRHDLALKDAEQAVLYGHARSKRASIQAAQHRRVVTLYNLGRYGDAKHILDIMRPWVGEEDKKGKMQIDMWMAKAEAKLKAATGEQKVVTVEEKPKIELPAEKERVNILKRQLNADGSYNLDWESRQATTGPAPADAAEPLARSTASNASVSTMPSAAAGKVRHEWYQNAQSVIITLYAKGVPKDKAEIDVQDDSVTISFPHPANPTSEFSFTLDPLFALVDAAGSTSRILSTKVEITLKKATQGQKWSALEGTEPLKKSASSSESAARAAVMSTLQQPTTASAPSYPTSSKSGPKNWDKVASDLTAKKKKKKDKDKEDGSDDDGVDSDYDTGDAVDSFFKKLYADSDPDTRRAMMKSFQESNGTALSTNWADVGTKRVEPVESKDD